MAGKIHLTGQGGPCQCCLLPSLLIEPNVTHIGHQEGGTEVKIQLAGINGWAGPPGCPLGKAQARGAWSSSPCGSHRRQAPGSSLSQAGVQPPIRATELLTGGAPRAPVPHSRVHTLLTGAQSADDQYKGPLTPTGSTTDGLTNYWPAQGTVDTRTEPLEGAPSMPHPPVLLPSPAAPSLTAARRRLSRRDWGRGPFWTPYSIHGCGSHSTAVILPLRVRRRSNCPSFTQK